MSADPLSLLCYALAGLWVLLAAGRLLDLRSVPVLRSVEPTQPHGDPPAVTAVVTARNEERRIARNVRALLNQRGVELPGSRIFAVWQRPDYDSRVVFRPRVGATALGA